MKRIHETLYRTPELIKLFIVFYLFFYFLSDIFPPGESSVPIFIVGVICAGLGVGLLTALFQKPKAKKNLE